MCELHLWYDANCSMRMQHIFSYWASSWNIILTFPHPGDIFVIEETIVFFFLHCLLCFFFFFFESPFWSPSHGLHVFKALLCLQFIITKIWYLVMFFCANCIVWTVYWRIWMWLVYHRLEFLHILTCVWNFLTY